MHVDLFKLLERMQIYCCHGNNGFGSIWNIKREPHQIYWERWNQIVKQKCVKLRTVYYLGAQNTVTVFCQSNMNSETEEQLLIWVFNN